jgi:hypothetical protein
VPSTVVPDRGESMSAGQWGKIDKIIDSKIVLKSRWDGWFLIGLITKA